MDENKKYFAIAITRTCGSGGGRQWKNPENYDLCLNTESLGLDHCVELIKKFEELKFWICSSEKEIL